MSAVGGKSLSRTGTARRRPVAGRRAVSAVMTTLTAACAFLVVGVLLLILGYIAWQGVSSLSLEFLIDTPKPVGEGGGIGNAILGTLVLLALASAIGLPVGIAAGVYLAEFGARLVRRCRALRRRHADRAFPQSSSASSSTRSSCSR